jgi:hypothetical protein
MSGRADRTLVVLQVAGDALAGRICVVWIAPVFPVTWLLDYAASVGG